MAALQRNRLVSCRGEPIFLHTPNVFFHGERIGLTTDINPG